MLIPKGMLEEELNIVKAKWASDWLVTFVNDNEDQLTTT